MKKLILIILWANIVTISSGDTYNYGGRECNKCPPGTYVKQHCSVTSQTECEACPYDTFSDQPTQNTACQRCQRFCLRKYEQVMQRCNGSHNIICHCEPGYWLKDASRNYCEDHRTCRPGTGVQTTGTPFSDTRCRRCGPGMYSDVYSATEPCLKMTDCVGAGMIIQIPGNARKDNLCVVSTSAYNKEDKPVEEPAKPPETPPSPGQGGSPGKGADELQPGEKRINLDKEDDGRAYYHAAPMATILPPFNREEVNVTVTTSTVNLKSTTKSSNKTDAPGYRSSGSVGAQMLDDADQPWKSYVLIAGLAVGSLIIIFVVVFSACFLLRMKRKWPFKKKDRHTTYDEAKDPLNIGQQMHKVFGFVAANCHVVTWQEFIRSLRGNEVSQEEIDSITSRSRGSVVQHIYQCLSLWYAKNNSATVEDITAALIECGELNLAEQVAKENPQTRIIYR